LSCERIDEAGRLNAGGRIHHAKDRDALRGGKLPKLRPTEAALPIVAVGKHQNDPAAGQRGERAGNHGECVDERDAVAAGAGFAFAAMEFRLVDRLIESGGKRRAVGWDVVGGADELAVERVDRDVIPGMQLIGRESRDGLMQGWKQVADVRAEVDQNGQRDGVVALEAHVGGAECGTAFEPHGEARRIEMLQGPVIGVEHESCQLHEVGVDVQHVGLVGSLILRNDRQRTETRDAPNQKPQAPA
jgi:hypothetical protein